VCVTVRGTQHRERGNFIPDHSFLSEVAELEVSHLSNPKR
jgi:hypothetical protein